RRLVCCPGASPSGSARILGPIARRIDRDRVAVCNLQLWYAPSFADLLSATLCTTGLELGHPGKALRGRALDLEGPASPRSTNDRRIAREALSLVVGDGERMVVRTGDGVPGDERGAVRVAARGKHLADRVAERQDQHPPVVERVVEREDRRLLTAV